MKFVGSVGMNIYVHRTIVGLICFFSVASCVLYSQSDVKTKRFADQLSNAQSFLSQHKQYNQDICFLIDMARPSGEFRFFIYSLKKDSVIHSGLVAHGSGSEGSESEDLIFSNVPNSYQSSLGNYKVGTSYVGSFGKSYKLHGLDATNNNALKRAIVLHPYSCVPDEEQDIPICLSLGCPMVSTNFMKILYGIIDTSSRPILMRIYYK